MVVNMFQQLLFLIIIFNNAGMSLPCDPGEVTQPYNFTANISKPNVLVRWRWNGNGGDGTIATCTSAKCTPFGENMYEVTRSDLVTTLQIKNVTTQSGGIYTCEDDEKFFNCNLKVYAKPANVRCQDPEFRAGTQDVAVVCTVQRIYPNPVCRFSWFIDENTDSQVMQKNLVEYKNLTGSENSSYINQNCTFNVPAGNFTLGKHQFHLTAYPNITGQDSDTAYNKSSSLTSPKSVVSPNATLNCSDTTVQENKQVSCTCTETANTFILATTTLFYGTANVSSSLQHITASITVNRYTSEIICQAQLPEGTKTNKTQSLNVYYGPSNVLVRVFYNQTESDVISLCGQSVTVTVTCNVSVNDVSPGVKYRIYSNVTAAYSNVTAAYSNITAAPVAVTDMAAMNYTVTNGGIFYFRCTGQNTYNSSLSATSTEKLIQVSEPPKLPPVIDKYQDGDTSVIVAAGDGQLTVQEGLAKIRCRVDGGYPPVSGLLLECGSQTNTRRDNNIYIDINITRHMHGSNCSCTATHSSSCYRNNTAPAVLDVNFASTILDFDVNSTSKQIIIDRNSTVSFSCQAEGNPSPSLSLRTNGTELQQFNDSTRNFNLTLTYNMTMSKCLDTGVYMCHAGNEQTTTNKTVTVYVKCMQQFTNPDNLRHIKTGQVNGTVLINVSVFGYPEPNVTLNSSKYVISSDAYNLTYIKQEPPYGIVSLLMNIENASFFQNYSLNINNAEGQLTYSFEIVEGVLGTPGPEMRDSDQDVGAIVGGIVAAVLVIVIIFVIIFLLKRKGAPCKRKEHPYANTSRNGLNGSDESVNAPAKKVDIGSRDQEVTIDNTALYNMGRKSQEVEIDNIIYNMDNTVEIDNSDLYNMNRHDLVEIDNSDLYNMNRSELGNPKRESEYKNYSEVTPTITSATSMPLNMRSMTQDTNPYEDVSSQTKNKPKPPAPQKPKPAARPKPEPGRQEGQKAKTAARDQTYATVVKVPKSDKSFAIKEDKDEFFADPSLQPEVPDKNFENPYEDTVNEKSNEKKSSDKNNKADKPNGKASQQQTDPSSLAYTNNGFPNPEGEVTV